MLVSWFAASYTNTLVTSDLRTSTTAFCIALFKEITVALAPLPVAFREGVEALLAHTVHMPEGMSEVHPFLCPIASYRAVKALTDAWEGLLQKSNQVVETII